MQINELIWHFQNVKANSDGSYNADCPLCNSKHANSRHLKITPTVNSNGKNTVMMNCIKCGSSTEAIMQAVGLTMRDLYEDDGQQQRKSDNERRINSAARKMIANYNSPAMEIAAIKAVEQSTGKWQEVTKAYEGKRYHSYTNTADGSENLRKSLTAYAVTERNTDTGEERTVRKKSAGWERYDVESGQWVSRCDGLVPALYHNDRLNAEKHKSNATKAVFIVEGEKDVETMERLQVPYPATTYPHGAGGTKKWCDEYTEAFKGFTDAYILTDNDEAGKEYGQFMAGHTLGIVGSVYVIPCECILQGLQEKGDISDIAEKVGDDETVKLLYNTLGQRDKYKYMPPQPKPSEQKKPFDFGNWGIKHFMYTPTQYLWYPYIPLEEITVLAADAGKGKGRFYARLAADLSVGKEPPAEDWGTQRRMDEGKRVFILSAEDKGGKLRGQFDALGADLDKIFVADQSGLTDENGNELAQTKCEYYDFAEKADHIEEALQGFQPYLLVVDTIEDFIGSNVNMNALNEVSAVLRRLQNLAEKYHCAILLISHTNKKENLVNILNSINGSSGFANKARSVLTLEVYNEAGKRAVVQVKQNNAAAAGKAIIFKIHTAENGAGIAEWDGFAFIDGNDILKARERRQTLESTVQAREDAADDDTYIIDQIKERCPEDGSKIRIPYFEIDGLDGKRTLDRIAPILRNVCVIVEALKTPFKCTDDLGVEHSSRGFSVYRSNVQKDGNASEQADAPQPQAVSSTARRTNANPPLAFEGLKFAFDECVKRDGQCTIEGLSEYFGKSRSTVYSYVANYPDDFEVKSHIVTCKHKTTDENTQN